MFFQDLTFEQAVIIFENSLLSMDNDEFFKTLGTSIEELRSKEERDSKMRKFNETSTLEDVENMTIEEAIYILERDANSKWGPWEARPYKAKACQIAVEALKGKEGKK